MRLKNILIIVTMLTVATIIICIAKIQSPDNLNAVTDVFSNAADKQDEVYVVKQKGEKIGVYAAVDDDLYFAIDTYIFTLPLSDQNMIEKGFKITSDEIMHVVEDYTG